MSINDISTLYILIIINVVIFIIGYLLGKNHTSFLPQHDKPKSFFDTNTTENNKTNISINEKKFVVDIKTNDLEKKYETLGDTKKTQENITNSVNKLKSMKG
jgi:cytoskeletal protein RodZ